MVKLVKESLNEAITLDGTTDKSNKAKIANKEFGHLLPDDCKFGCVKTPKGRHRLVIKCGGKNAYEFMTGLFFGVPNKKELTADWIKRAVSSIKK